MLLWQEAYYTQAVLPTIVQLGGGGPTGRNVGGNWYHADVMMSPPVRSRSGAANRGDWEYKIPMAQVRLRAH